MTGLEVILPYLAAAGAAVSAVGVVSAADSAASAQEYNSKIEEQKAVNARTQGASEIDLQREKGRQIIGRQLAAGSESGTGLNGSNKDILGQSLYGMASDSLNIQYNTETKAQGMLAQGALDKSQVDATRTGGYLSAAGKLIGGSSSYLTGNKSVPTSFGADLSNGTRGSGD